MSYLNISVLDPPTHSCQFDATVERFINMGVTPKKNIRPSFYLILKLSNALDGLLSVLSRLHGRKHKCVFASLNVTTIIYCCLEASRSGFFLAWNSLFIFRYRCCNRHFAGFSKTYFLDFRLPLLWFCLLIVLRALVHLI